jgi:hypothetical protein
MVLSRPLTSALPTFFFCSVFLAASFVASVRAEDSDNITQGDQPATNRPSQTNNPTGLSQPVAIAMTGNTALSAGASQPTTQVNTNAALANLTNAHISLQQVDGQLLRSQSKFQAVLSLIPLSRDNCLLFRFTAIFQACHKRIAQAMALGTSPFPQSVNLAQ